MSESTERKEVSVYLWGKDYCRVWPEEGVEKGEGVRGGERFGG